MHTTSAAALVAPRPPGWWMRNWKWVVPVGVAALVSVVVAVCLGFLALIFGLMRQTEVYQTALDEAQGAPQVIERLGTPIEDGFLVTGNIEVNPSSGYADLAIPIEGPDGRGVIHVEAEKSGGEWSYYTLEVSTNDGAGAIDLLADW